MCFGDLGFFPGIVGKADQLLAALSGDAEAVSERGAWHAHRPYAIDLPHSECLRYIASALHEIATIGFYGGASRVDGAMTPTYTMMFGGKDGEEGMLGKSVMRVPAKRVIDTLMKIIEIYKQERSAEESLSRWISKLINGVVKIGRASCRERV